MKWISSKAFLFRFQFISLFYQLPIYHLQGLFKFDPVSPHQLSIKIYQKRLRNTFITIKYSLNRRNTVHCIKSYQSSNDRLNSFILKEASLFCFAAQIWNPLGSWINQKRIWRRQVHCGERWERKTEGSAKSQQFYSFSIYCLQGVLAFTVVELMTSLSIIV